MRKSCLLDPFTHHCCIYCGFNTFLEIIKLQNFFSQTAYFWHHGYTCTIFRSILPWTLTEQGIQRVLPRVREVSKLLHRQRSLSHSVWPFFPDRYKHADISRLRAVRGSFSGKAHSWLKPQSGHIMHIERKSRSNGPWKAPWVRFPFSRSLENSCSPC